MTPQSTTQPAPTPPEFSTKPATDQRLRTLHTRYLEIVRRERTKRSHKAYIEKGIAGGLAFLIGSYGLYFSRQSPVTKMVYSLTQSGGIAAMGHAYYELHAPSLLLRQQTYLDEHGRLPDSVFERMIVQGDEQRRSVQARTLAATAGVLAAINAYDSFANRKSIALRNFYGFAAFNLALVSGASAYKAYRDDFTDKEELGDSMDLAFLPGPTLTFSF